MNAQHIVAEPTTQRGITAYVWVQEYRDLEYRDTGEVHEVEVTHEILALKAAQIAGMVDDTDSTNDLVNASELGFDGPHRVVVADGIRKYFGVEDIAAVTDAMVSAARHGAGGRPARVVADDADRSGEITQSVVVVAYHACWPIKCTAKGALYPDGGLVIQYPFLWEEIEQGDFDPDAQIDISHLVLADGSEIDEGFVERAETTRDALPEQAVTCKAFRFKIVRSRSSNGGVYHKGCHITLVLTQAEFEDAAYLKGRIHEAIARLGIPIDDAAWCEAPIVDEDVVEKLRAAIGADVAARFIAQYPCEYIDRAYRHVVVDGSAYRYESFSDHQFIKWAPQLSGAAPSDV